MPEKVDIDTSTLNPMIGILKALPNAATFQIKIGDAVFTGPATLIYSNAGASLEYPEPPKPAKKSAIPANAGGA